MFPYCSPEAVAEDEGEGPELARRFPTLKPTNFYIALDYHFVLAVTRRRNAATELKARLSGGGKGERRCDAISLGIGE
jgi:hypothetical protein